MSVEKINYTNDYVPPHVAANLSKYEYSSYYIGITGFNDSYDNFVGIAIQYVIPNFIRKQGDYYFAHLPRSETGGDENYWFYFPADVDVIPTNIPQDIEAIRGSRYNGSHLIPSWVFKFKGGQDRIFFYTNFREMKEQEEALQDKYTWKGFWLALPLSLLVLGIELFFGDKIKKKGKEYFNKIYSLKVFNRKWN